MAVNLRQKVWLAVKDIFYGAIKYDENDFQTYRWRARNDTHSVTVGDKEERLLLQPNGGPVFIQDLDKGRRPATLEDFANIIKLCQASDEVSLIGSFPVEPGDVRQKEKHLKNF